MVGKILVDREISAGKRLVEELDRARFPLDAAVWFYLPDEQRYRLLLATKIVDRDGPLAAYDRIEEALQKLPTEQRLDLVDISAVSPSDTHIDTMKKMVRTPAGTSSIRFTNVMLGDLYIDDAFVYRLN